MTYWLIFASDFTSINKCVGQCLQIVSTELSRQSYINIIISRALSQHNLKAELHLFISLLPILCVCNLGKVAQN